MIGQNKKQHKQYIIITQGESGIRQRNLSQQRIFTFAILAVVTLSILFFATADVITQFIYNHKIKKIKNHYTYLSENLIDIQQKLDVLSSHMEKIEEKDKAIRTYAGMPQIDQDIRQLGIGGVFLAEKNSNDPELKNRINSLEMDVETLSRKIKLELKSYTDIYSKVSKDIEHFRAIPAIRPIEGGYLNSGFGYRKDPISQKMQFHYGQDITVNQGEKVIAPADGFIEDAQYTGGYGKYIKIEHGYGYSTLYGHLSEIQVKKGQKIHRGDIIGLSGNTGRSTAPHLHYEVYHNGTPQNPLDYFLSAYLQ